MKTLYLESIAGIAGDMFTAGFIDAGLVTPDDLQALCEQLRLPNVKIIVSQVLRSHMRATHVNVCFENLTAKELPLLFQNASHAHIHYLELDQFIKQSGVPKHTKQLARKILNTLAEAEACCHGVAKENVVFHEIGMIDSLMDIVMSAHCINQINPDKIMASPVKLGRGFIQTAHGCLPVPPPVSAALVVDMHTASMPELITIENIELSTPTGLAILKTLNPVFATTWPTAQVITQGYGAGTKDLDSFPNLFRVCLLDTVNNCSMDKPWGEKQCDGISLPYLQDSIFEITTNYDDASPEYLAWAMEQLFECGAVDVWQTTAVGKKSRVMIILSILVHESNYQNCVDFILKKTPTFGLRYRQLDRFILDRYFENRTTDEGTFRVKIGCNTQGQKLKEKLEFEDVRNIRTKE